MKNTATISLKRLKELESYEKKFHNGGYSVVYLDSGWIEVSRIKINSITKKSKVVSLLEKIISGQSGEIDRLESELVKARLEAKIANDEWARTKKKGFFNFK